MAANNDIPGTPPRARYVMVGGFLGAGKTTSILRLADWLNGRGRQVGLISNDQGGGLVDTALYASHRHAVREIAGGCFCCRFNSLVEAARQLTVEARPDVFVAEPVGSCTDLVATVTYPLRQIYGADYSIAPLSVLVDPIRASRVLDLEAGSRFSEKVRYIYRKQLEEADVIVVNKCDLIQGGRPTTLRAALEKEFPHARVFEVSARSGDGLEEWFQWIASAEQKPRALMEVDYEIYAAGEARLGWLNGTVALASSRTFDANEFLERLARRIQSSLVATGAEVAHLKMTFDPRSAFGDIAAVNLVRNDFVPELSQTLPEPVERGDLTINLRAEASPENLSQVVKEAMQDEAARVPNLGATWQHLESFKPGKPQPSHRAT